VCGHHHVIAASDPGRYQGQRKRRGAGCHPDALACLAVVGELSLERLDFRAEDEGVGVHDSSEGGGQLAGQPLVLPSEAHEWHMGLNGVFLNGAS
jgi:hypothetical protein